MTTHKDFGDGLHWTKAGASGGDNGGCVYTTKDTTTGLIGLRDGKAGPQGPVLWFNRREIAAFFGGTKAGEFDHLLD